MRYLLGLLLCSLLAFTGCGKAAPQATTQLADIERDPDALLAFVPQVVAMADGAVILTRESLIREVKPLILQALKHPNARVKQEAARRLCVSQANALVSSMLMVEASRAAGMKADDQRVQEKMRQMEADVNKQNPSVPNHFDAVIAQLGMTREALQQKFAAEDLMNQYIAKLVMNEDDPKERDAIIAEEINRLRVQRKVELFIATAE